MAIFSEFQSIFQALISILAIVNVVMILGNLLKVIISWRTSTQKECKKKETSPWIPTFL
jgi:uncharacterized DUF497 family protein